MTRRLESLRAELVVQRQALTEARDALDRERSQPAPDRQVLAQQRLMVADAEAAVRAAEDDLRFEEARLHSDYATASRAEAREKLDAALKLHGGKAASTWRTLDANLHQLVETAQTLSKHAAQVSEGVKAAAFEDLEGGAALATLLRTAVTAIDGNEAHALLIAQRLREFAGALPASLRDRVGAYVEFNAFALSGQHAQPIQQIVTTSCEQLRVRVGDLCTPLQQVEAA